MDACNITLEFFTADAANLSQGARLLLLGLWTISDPRYQRTSCDPAELKARLFPRDDINIVPLLDELSCEVPDYRPYGFIMRIRDELNVPYFYLVETKGVWK